MTPRGRIGTTIREKYRVDKYIATGSMANVYAATHRNGGRVALKILHRELAADPSMRERFKREGWFVNNIDHPGIAKAIDDDVTEDGCPFIVMDLLEGENLEVRRKRLGGRLPLGEVLTVADGVLDVLAAAHAKGVLHRDLKPENVFFTHDGDLKLLDFGVARFDDKKDRSEVTGVGMVLGTPAFMPPEQALGKREEVDARSDLWALGATLFMMLTGESVHTGDTAKAKLLATATSRARKLRDVAPNIPRAVASVVDRALEFDRGDRWDDAKAMKQALRWARMSLDPEAGVPTSASPDVENERRTASFAPAPTTKRAATDDEPTVMRRFPMGDGDVPDSSRDVFTSAPKMPMSLAASSEGPTFSLRNDPVFSLRRAKPFGEPPGDEPTPETQRLPGASRDDTNLPSLVDEVPPSEDVRMEYTRPMMAVPHLRGTLPLPGAPGPIAPAASSPGTSRPAPSSGPAVGLVQQVAPRPSLAGRIAVWLTFAALLGGTVLVLMWKKREADAPRPVASASSEPAVSAAPGDSESAAPIASAAPEPPASESAVASSAAAPAESASAAPPASAVAVKPRPRPKPTATATASASATTSATSAGTSSSALAPESTASPPVPVPMPVPVPGPGPVEGEN